MHWRGWRDRQKFVDVLKLKIKFGGRISDGLGVFFSVSQSMHLSARKRPMFGKFFILVVLMHIIYVSKQETLTVSNISLILALQRSNETFKSIKHPFKRINSARHKNVKFSFILFMTLFIGTCCLWLLNFLLLSGDIHPNPGPDSVNSVIDTSLTSSLSFLDSLSNHISILHLNIQSLFHKMDLIRCEAQSYDILVFSESWLKPEIKDHSIAIENFLPPQRTDRFNRPGGGVVVYVKDSFLLKRRSDLEIQGLEAVWVEIRIHGKTLLLGGFYRPPKSNNDYFNLILESVDRAYNTNITDIVITGDFNYNMLSADASKLKELISQYNLIQTLTEPTHFTENSSSLIDLFLIRNEGNVLCSEVIDPFIPDQTRYHCPILLLLKFLRPQVKSTKRKIWNYAKADFNRYRTLLLESNIENDIETNDNIEQNVESIFQVIKEASEQAIPHKIVTIRPQDHPWISCAIRKLIRKRKRAYKKYKRTSNLHYWNKYKRLRNTCVSEIRESKKSYYENLQRLLSTENINSKLFWKTSKQMLNLKSSSTKIPTLFLNGVSSENETDKANMLNDYFSSQTVINNQNKQIPFLDLVIESTLDSIIISVQDVKDVLQNLDPYKAHGPNHISPYLLKEGASILSKSFTIIFNRSLLQGYFPSSWKDGYLTPIHKKDDKSLPMNYRPISLLDPIGKVMERCVHKHLFNYIQENRILTPFQSGFIPGDSTTFQLLHTYHTFCEAVDSGKEVRVVFCDISKAFDRVWHRGLLYKLSRIGCSDHVIKWFSSYLSNRRQCVILSGATSEWASVHAGVPQGSILGPLLFLIFINDIVKNINSCIRLFADDTSLYIIVENPQAAAVSLNLDLNTISDWALDWLVDFNARKTMSLLISLKSNAVSHPHLFMNDTIISESTSHKHLGITFSNTCSWTEHISKIIETASTRLNLLRALKFKINRKSLEKIYIAFIRPLLEYSDSVWDNCSTECKNQLESIHNEAARIVSGATKLCSLEKLLAELGWETLQQRRTKHKLIIFYKIVNGLTPDYLPDVLPPLVGDGNPYSLRNANDIQTMRARTNLFFNSFFPSTIRAWNNLPQDIKDAASVTSFKYRLNRNMNRCPTYYNVGSRIGQILHARLRMECSSLHSHLYSKHIVPSPSCACGEFESSYHFLLRCPRYTDIRNTYLSNYLHTHSVQELLHGKPAATEFENETMFCNVQEFLVKSKRFL